MKRIIIACFCLLFAIVGAAQNVQLDNETLHFKIENGTVSLSNSKLQTMVVNHIVIRGKMLTVSSPSKVKSIWGKGKMVEALYDNGRKVTFTLYPSNPFLYIHTSIVNSSSVNMECNKMDIAKIEMSIGNGTSGLNHIGSGGLTMVEKAKGSYGYSMLADPNSRNSILVSWLTQKQGVGTVKPQLGRDGTYTVEAALEFGHYQVKPQSERETDVLLIGLFADGRVGLETYADYLAKSYNIKLPAKPNVYCTWYHRADTGSGASNEKMLTQNATFASSHLKSFGLNVLQIDDNWQSSMMKGVDYNTDPKKAGLGVGPIKTFTDANGNFPNGMECMAKTINDNGFDAGIWFIPFAGDWHHKNFDKSIFAKDSIGRPYEAKLWSGTCIDASNPKGEQFLRDRFKRIYNWGYRYFKIDGLHIGAPSENIYVNRSYDGKPIFGKAKIDDEQLTFVQCFRKGLSILNEEAPNAFLLGCAATQNMSSLSSSFGLIDAMRVGPDNDGAARGVWSDVTAGADFAGNLYFLNNKVWYNDPDPFYIQKTISLDKARWMASWQAISGALGTSSVQYADLTAERLELLKRTLPTHNINARPIDILENAKPAIWMVSNERVNIVGLFNWKEKQNTVIKYPLQRMGFDDSKEYLMFDYWENKYLGELTHELNMKLLPASCKVLAVVENKNVPQVISTSRHITQGLMDVLAEKWNAKKRILQGTSNVVKDDMYEIRVIVPENMELDEAVCGTISMETTFQGKLLKALFTPKETGTVKWEIRFKDIAVQ